MLLVVLSIFLLLLFVDGSPVANYPINAQLPPVARVSQPFNFTYSPGTFTNSGSKIKYSLSKAPSWLQLDSENCALTGTPDSDDVGTETFDLVAEDDSGSASMEVTLIVAADEGPKPGKPILPQLEKTGPTSAPSTIFVHPGDSFNISFAPDTFRNTNSSTVYYATSPPDNSPLPSWIKFDPSTLEFSGSAPGSPPSGSQSFSFNLVASDVEGFSAATLCFSIVVSTHILAFDDSAQTLDMSRGKSFASPQYYNSLKLDGEEPASDKLTDISMEGPDWVSLNKSSISISGTSPSDAVNENVTISVSDIHQDVAKLIVSLQFSQLFTDGITGCNATIGEDFMFVFNQSVITGDAVDLEVDLGEPLSSWLQYNPDNKTLHGRIPTDTRPQKFPITLTASQGSTQNSKEFTINAVDSGNSGNTAQSSKSDSINLNKAGIISISVVIPLVFLSIVLLLFCCWRRKRRAAKHDEGQLSQEKGVRSDLATSELPECHPRDENTQDEVLEALRRHSSSSKPPKLELRPLWSADSGERKSAEGNTENKENALTHSTIEWDFAPLKPLEPQEEEAEDSQCQNWRSSQSSPPVRRSTINYSRPRDPLKPIQPRRSLKRSSLSAKSKRNSKRSSGLSSVASGLPMRLSGAGHGAGGFGPPGHGIVRLSWQNPQALLPSDENSFENLAPLFPRPPPVRRKDSISLGTTEHSKGATLRPVESRHSTISESGSLEAFVHNRAKCRNSSNPMFSGQGSRRISSGRNALGRARSTLSQGRTVSSITSDDGSKQSTRERPISTAMSGSIYTDENRDSREVRPLSQESSALLSVPFFKGQSQSSLAQNYRDVVAPFPRFFSESSLASGWRGESDGTSQGVEDYGNLIDERQEDGGQRRWYRVNNALSPSSASGLNHRQLGKSPSMSSVPFDSKVRRVSLVRFAGKDTLPSCEVKEQRWRLGENQERRRVSIEEASSLPRDLRSSESVRGDMAFV
ncbi:CADG [Aspergillus sclerotialis]|uniref:CADG n=1 Tax=Aspergillus sclerotialis TaxID=2070753 RepID=A0A3A2ZZG0_9EURO|nr:CADG [Aspergillus sclerotialis]